MSHFLGDLTRCALALTVARAQDGVRIPARPRNLVNITNTHA